MSTVMVVDDEERIRTLLSRTLSSLGHSVVSAVNGEAALDRLRDGGIDLVLLDLVMPGGSGLNVLSALREQKDEIPVIVISGVTEVGARVEALDRGAVDVVAKPFSIAELMARVRRNLATHRPSPAANRLEAAGILLDLDRRRALVDGRKVTLTEREFVLLAHLMRRRGHVCTREELLHDVWGLDFDPGSNVLEVCIRRLRGKFGREVPIETVRGVGYCLSED
ncbi:MAG TPA: response regulator transcription factor [Segeticoccus sp.]|uniref:response regulator transcription factor n=1 Tax=Segeticoccus sp. TaxID=2706531 RepID=UPI002D7F07FE|nr:response regulator transcription factor [Segeticoccus sp.]HET8599101.1 response regulator transcription factor [Segeticoccus sp.]